MTRHQTTRTGRIAGALAVITLLAAGAAPAPAHAQETDGRWLAWMGCWQSTEGPAEADAPGALLCARPAPGDTGIELVALEDGDVVAREVVRADGRRHEVEREGCSGWERGDFATQAGRVYLTSELVCEGGVERASTGVMAIVSTDEWVDIRVVGAGDQPATWVTRYRLASAETTEAAGFGEVAAERGLAVRSARAAAVARPSVDDVIEASRHVDPEAVSAWLAERDAMLDIDADALVRMADAGVPEGVIDMAIAVSYPDHFALAGGGEGAAPRDRYGYDRAYRWGYYNPFFFYDPYFFGSRYYSPFGFGPYGFGYGFGFRSRGFHRPIVIIERGARDSGGRVINGRGYRSGSRGSGRSAGSNGMRVPRSGRSGAVSGSSRGSTGRTAKRRGGDGGDGGGGG